MVEDGWIRLPPTPRPMLAGFGRIANRCKEGQAVVAVDRSNKPVLPPVAPVAGKE